jgi:hypothetical protein
MAHEISGQQLLAAVEGSADSALAGRIQAHLSVCSECAAGYEQLRTWQERLSAEGARIREAMTLEDDVTERLLADSMERIAAAGPPSTSAAEGLAMLRSLLTPVFGAGTVQATTDMALRSAAPTGITGAAWAAFADALSEMLEAICGIAAGRLALRAAAALPVAGKYSMAGK